MIKSKEDLNYYLEQDRLALGIKPTLKNKLTHDIWHFQIALRKLEYRKNTGKSVFSKIYGIFPHIYF